MKGFSGEAELVMIDRFGKDTVIALATTKNEMPHVRYVNACYEMVHFISLPMHSQIK